MDPATFDNLRSALLLFIVLMLSVSLHEYGHAKVADLLGDPLPRSQGRVTLVPWAHWDPMGTLLPALFIIGPALMGMGATGFVIGWGKPVMISLPNKKTRVRDDILITLAGPGMNLVIALVSVVLGGLFLRFTKGGASGVDEEFAARTVHFVILTLSLNIGLIAFNLLPVPPLDGSHILRHVTRMKEETYAWLMRNSLWIFLALILVKIGDRSLAGWLAWPLQQALAYPLTGLLLAIAGIDSGE